MGPSASKEEAATQATSVEQATVQANTKGGVHVLEWHWGTATTNYGSMVAAIILMILGWWLVRRARAAMLRHEEKKQKNRQADVESGLPSAPPGRHSRFLDEEAALQMMAVAASRMLLSPPAPSAPPGRIHDLEEPALARAPTAAPPGGGGGMGDLGVRIDAAGYRR